jgi:hypothetical protein
MTLVMRAALAVDGSSMGVMLRQSTWMFAAMEVVHLLGLALLLGTTLAVDLRLLGVALGDQPVRVVAMGTRAWNTVGLLMMVGSGSLLAASEPLKLAASPPFGVKMALLAAAVIYTYTVQAFVIRRPGPAIAARLSALVSLTLWFGVALAGRVIAFY